MSCRVRTTPESGNNANVIKESGFLNIGRLEAIAKNIYFQTLAKMKELWKVKPVPDSFLLVSLVRQKLYSDCGFHVLNVFMPRF